MTKLRIIVSILIAVVSGTIISFSVAMAQENVPSDTSPGKFATKLAEILGLNPTTVDQAVQQARTEIRESLFQERLNKLVTSGKLTEEQAKEKLGEFRSEKQLRYVPDYKPDFKSRLRSKSIGPKFKGKSSRMDIAKRIKAAVQRGDLTEEQAKEKLGEFRSEKQLRYVPDYKPDFKSRLRSKSIGPKFKGKPSRIDIEKRIKAAVQRGDLTEEQAKEKLQSLNRDIKRN